ncbi:MAG: NADH-quinone oxidoreductase subunit L [Armatimonadota bacterium]
MPAGSEYLLIPGLPLLAFLLIAAFGLRPQDERAAPVPIIAALCGSLYLSLRALAHVAAAGPQEFSFPWLYVGPIQLDVGVLVDNLSALMMAVVSLVSLLVQIYSIGYMKGEIGYGRYFAYMSLFSGSMLALVISDNIVQTYIFWELVGICSYLLIGFWYRRPSAAAAAKKAFVVTRFGDLGFLSAVLVLSFLGLGIFGFTDLAHAAEQGALSKGLITTVCLLLFCGAMGKSAQFPLHIWLPDAMEGPTPVSALIHAATMVAAGVYLVARTYFLFALAPAALLVVAIIGCITLFLAATMGVAEDDIKRVLAYSTISQLGYMMLGLAVGGYTAGVFHLTTHAFFKALLFLTAGSVIHSVSTNNMWQMGGLGRRMPVTSLTCLVGALALAGIIPLSGFWSKDAILAAVLSSHLPGHQVMFVVALVGVSLTAFYMFRLWFVTFTGKARTEAAEHAHESPWVMTVPLLILAFIAVVAGALRLHVPFAAGGIAEVIRFGHEPETHSTLVIAGSFLCAMAGIGVAWATYRAEHISSASFNARFPAVLRLLKNGWYINRAWELFATRVVIAGSALAAWFDRHVVDGMVSGVAWLCGAGSQQLRRLQTGQVQLYAFVVALGIIAALIAVLGGAAYGLVGGGG